MLIRPEEVVRQAQAVVKETQSRDPWEIADFYGIQILVRDFKEQLGVYIPVCEVPFIFIKKGLSPEIAKTVLLHEIGHHRLHREACLEKVIPEFELFSNANDRMEIEANLFAAEVAIGDEEFFELVKMDYDAFQIAQYLGVDQNLVALKIDSLIKRGYPLRKQEFSSKFLKK